MSRSLPIFATCRCISSSRAGSGIGALTLELLDPVGQVMDGLTLLEIDRDSQLRNGHDARRLGPQVGGMQKPAEKRNFPELRAYLMRLQERGHQAGKYMGLALLPLTLVAWGCGTLKPAALRHPDFRPDAIRRPAVVLQVSLDPGGLLGEGEFSARERTSIPEAFEIALLEGLNAEGILPVDVTRSARQASRDSLSPLWGGDRRQALARARTLKADVLLILSASLSRLDVVYCREARRPFMARTTVWTLGAEVVRVTDGARLLLEPSGAAQGLGDVEPDCDQGRISRRLSTQELLDMAVQRGLALLLGR